MSDWQSVDRLPGEYEAILIGRDAGKLAVMPGCWTGERWLSFSIVGALEFVNPTHWMPLPPPPAR